MTNRRNFIKQLSAAAVVGMVPNTISSQITATKKINTSTSPTSEKIWACLMHLSFNFAGGIKSWGGLRAEFETDQSVWDNAIKSMVNNGSIWL